MLLLCLMDKTSEVVVVEKVKTGGGEVKRENG